MSAIQFLWCQFGEFGTGSTNNPLIDIFFHSHLMCAWYWNDLVRRNSVFSRSLTRVKGLSWSHATIPILQLVLLKFLVLLTCQELELHLHTVNLLGTIPHSHLRPLHTLHTCMSIGMSVDKSWAKHFRVQHRLLTMSLQRNLCRQFVCKRFN